MTYRKFVCQVCSDVYDEALGDPVGSLPAGTRWEAIPADWVCRECGATKADFILVEEGLAAP